MLKICRNIVIKLKKTLQTIQFVALKAKEYQRNDCSYSLHPYTWYQSILGREMVVFVVYVVWLVAFCLWFSQCFETTVCIISQTSHQKQTLTDLAYEAPRDTVQIIVHRCEGCLESMLYDGLALEIRRRALTSKVDSFNNKHKTGGRSCRKRVKQM